MDELEQVEGLWEYGTHIDERADEVYNYILYSICNFYIELKYHREYNSLHGSRSFPKAEPLTNYLYINNN